MINNDLSGHIKQDLFLLLFKTMRNLSNCPTSLLFNSLLILRSNIESQKYIYACCCVHVHVCAIYLSFLLNGDTDCKIKNHPSNEPGNPR